MIGVYAFIATGIFAWFVGLAFFVWDDVKRLGERMLAEDVDADGLPPLFSPLGLTTVGVDGFPREWTLEHVGPFDVHRLPADPDGDAA